MVSYDGRSFRPENTAGPLVTYRQERDLLWAEIPAGDRVRRGYLAGRAAPDGTLDFAYCLVLEDGEVLSGRCHSTPLRRPGGGLRLRAEWERYGPGAATGVTYLTEVDPPPVIRPVGSALGRPGR
jgi:hypothetical protein